MRTPKANDLIEVGLAHANKAVSKVFDSDVIFFRSPLFLGVDDSIREYVEELKDNGSHKQKRLCVLVETTGGYIEVVERIYSVFRKHYEHVIFVVPSFAYSAGTVLVLSGDEIYMDYYSVLGPIDPQVDDGEDRFVPGIGYLIKFNELVKQINADSAGTNTRAQLAYLIKKFDPAKLFFIEQAQAHAIELLKEWLPKHKFKDWTVTETRKLPVTVSMKTTRADEIAQILGKPERWHSHGRGIGIRELMSDEIKVLVTNFGDDKKSNEAIRCYYDLLIDFFGKMGIANGLHGSRGYRRVS